MKRGRWLIVVGVALAFAFAVAGTYDPPYVPTNGIGANLTGTVLDWEMDRQSPMGWAIYVDEEGNYWKVRFQECDRVPGLTCPREVLYSVAIKPTKSL
jgi:hypothetical protein